MRNRQGTVFAVGAAVLALLIALPAVAAETYDVDQAHSTVGFSVRHIFTRVPGEFNDFQGTIVYDAENPANSSVEFTVEAASIDTDNDRRDGHLKSEDFFAVEQYPTLTFKSKKVSGSGDDLRVTGDLTIRGVTKEVTVPVDVLGAGGGKAGFATEFEVNRLDFGVSWNRAMEGGGAMLDDDVTVRIDIEANKAEEMVEGK